MEYKNWIQSASRNCFKRFLLLFLFVLVPLGSNQAQEEDPLTPSDHPQNLYFSKGLVQDVKLTKAPRNAKPMGSYQGHLDLKWDADQKVMRVYPRNEGDGTLNIIDPATNKVIYSFAF